MQCFSKLNVIIVFFICISFSIQAIVKPQASIPNKVGHALGDIIIDAVDLNLRLFSVDSAKIITGFLPFYTGARFIDESLQSHFYNPMEHKNVNQFPKAYGGIIQLMVFRLE
jgi:hypothetical protein